MPDTLTLHPDHWLICSPDVLRSIRGTWMQESPADSLAQLRLRGGQVESVPLPDTARRVKELASQEGCGTVHIVVERRGDAEMAVRAELDELDADMMWYVFRDSPLDVVGSINSPEGTLIEAWQVSNAMPTDFQVSGRSSGWKAEYLRALRRWAVEAKAEYPEELEWVDVYPAWRDVLAALRAAMTAAMEAGVGNVGTLASQFTARMFSTPRPARLGAGHGFDFVPAAAGGDDLGVWQLGDGVAVSVRDSGHDLEVRLAVEANLADVHLLTGAHVRIADATFDLSKDGRVNWTEGEEGKVVARCRVPYTDWLERAAEDRDTEVEVVLKRVQA